MKDGCTLQVVPLTAACPVTIGFTLSVVHVAVCTKGSLSLPHQSTYIHVFVCVLVQLVVVVVPTNGYPVLMVIAPVQLSVAVGSIKAGCWLHTVPVSVAVPVTTGFTLSVVHVAVCTKGSLSLPQASMYIQVLVCVEVHAVTLTVLV